MADRVPKTVLCLGNPGAEYSTTRHNVAWWLADRLAEHYQLGRFKQQGPAGIARGRIEGVPAQVVKPLTFMNRSGRIIEGIGKIAGFELASDLLVVVDEIALEPGRSRLRSSGSAGGHNGLKSIQAALGTIDYPRLRIGVGAPRPGSDLAQWVLSSPGRAERALILERIDALVECVGRWALEGVEAAMNLCNN